MESRNALPWTPATIMICMLVMPGCTRADRAPGRAGDPATIIPDNGAISQKQQTPNPLLVAAGERPAVKPFRTGKEKRVDNWVDAWMTAHSGPPGQPLSGAYEARHDILDATDAKNGYYSITFGTTEEKPGGAFGFHSGAYMSHWALSGDFSLHFWLKAMSPSEPKSWHAVLYDSAGRRVRTELSGMKADSAWRQFTLPLQTLEGDADFDHTSVRSVQIEAALPEGSRLWLDDVSFHHGDEVLGISDKTVTQYMAEAEATRPQRVDETLSGDIEPLVAQLYRGTDLEKANQDLMKWVNEGLVKQGHKKYWGLGNFTFLNRVLFGFSSKGKIRPGRLTPGCEKLLLKAYWELTKLKNDIATARHGPWWVTGSENHDINLKMAALLSSQLLMHDEDYAERVYPDLGRMQGSGVFT